MLALNGMDNPFYSSYFLIFNWLEFKISSKRGRNLFNIFRWNRKKFRFQSSFHSTLLKTLQRNNLKYWRKKNYFSSIQSMKNDEMNSWKGIYKEIKSLTYLFYVLYCAAPCFFHPIFSFLFSEILPQANDVPSLWSLPHSSLPCDCFYQSVQWKTHNLLVNYIRIRMKRMK